MAQPTLDKSMLILLGNGATPTEVFSFPCGANTRGVTFTNNTGEEVTLDCDDPDGEMAAIQRWVESQDTQLSIAGRVSNEAFDTWRKWADAVDNDGVKNIRIQIMNTVALGGGYWELPAILQTFEMGREGKASTTFTGTIVAAGKRSWTAAT